jgi:hypothetical protein
MSEDDQFSQTFIGRLKRFNERTGRRADDKVIGWLRALKELAIVVGIVVLALKGEDLGALLGLL